MAGLTLPGGIGRALHHRDLRIYLGGNLQSNVGTWAARLATGWLTWHLTQSAGWLGLMVFVELAPMVALAPAGGAIVDRYGALLCSKISPWSLAVLSFAPAVLVFGGIVNPYWLLALAVFQGVNGAINNPAHLSMLGEIVPPEDMRPAVALQAGIVQTSRFIGPVVAGFVLSFDDNVNGAGWVFLINGISYAFYGFMLNWIHVPAIERGERRGLGAEFMEGVRYAKGHAIIGSVLVFSAILSVLLRPVIDLFPAFADKVFARGPQGLSILLASMGIGSIIGVIVMAMRDRASGLEKIFAISSGASGLILGAFALTTDFWTATGLIGVFGFCNNISGICGQTLVQSEVAPAMRARILGMLGLTFRAVPAIGALVMGYAAETFGLATPVVTAAVLCLVAWPLLAAKLKRASATVSLET
jgi:MFS family permease